MITCREGVSTLTTPVKKWYQLITCFPFFKKIDEDLDLVKKNTNSKYNNIYFEKCSFVKMMSRFSLTTKKEHRLSPLRINLRTMNDYTII